ncbi:MAG: Lipase 3 protein [Dehalococcoidia bacterium]|nr:Lipase 3 protein [Dehalococcoidia bacterium]
MNGFDFDGKIREHSRKNAYWLGKMALLAYSQPPEARSVTQSWGLTTFQSFETEGTECFVTGNDDALIVAFRGTQDLRDWMTDVRISLVDVPGGKAHKGFRTALLYVWQDLWQYIQSERGRRGLWVTGHSLGGALANLLVAKLRLEEDEPVNGLYTFGQPRVGDRELARTFDFDFEPQTFRYVNNNDIVARVPFRSMGYSHVGLFKYFDEDGNQRDMNWWDLVVERIKGEVKDLLEPGSDDLKDHALEGYIANLERAMEVGP